MNKKLSSIFRKSAFEIKRFTENIFVKCVKASGLYLSEFDADFYLRNNSDVVATGANPGMHYLRYGRHEGRLAHAPSLDEFIRVGGWFDQAKESVLVVTHEASKTGAPILSLNLVRILKQRYNVVVLLLEAGPLIEAFGDEGAIVVGPCVVRKNPRIADFLLKQIINRYQLKFALVNSVESRIVLPTLSKYFIPTISLLHEFASNTRPRDAFLHAIFWSDEAVFSARLTYENAIEQYPFLGRYPARILPQGRCFIPQDKDKTEASITEREKILRVLRPPKNDLSQFLVIGVGLVQLRKGVDLFIECAARVIRNQPERCILFLWVGKGYDPDSDLAYSVYLHDQINRAGLSKHVEFIDETTCLDMIYEAADILLLSSRLDPLPNVAIDALSEGLPVLCFKETTGIADILIEGGLGEDCVAEYLDTQSLADKICRFSDDHTYYETVGQIGRRLAKSIFDMERYVNELEIMALDLATRTKQEQQDFDEIMHSSLLKQCYSCMPQSKSPPMEATVRGYVRSWVNGIGRRRLFPGFHPGIYLEKHGVSKSGADPFADFIRAGAPTGPWLLPVISNTDDMPEPLVNGRVALHVHAYYPGLLPEILRRLECNVVRPDLFISIQEGQSVEEIERYLKSYKGSVIAIEHVVNRGRDIGPFLTTFGSRIAACYDFVGHIHTKKTADIIDASVGAVWYQFLLENLLGGDSGRMMDRILGYMTKSLRTGMVFPEDPNVIGWDANREFALGLAERLGIRELPDQIVFPVGTMFWARVEALKPFWSMGLEWKDYPEEPLPYDGSILHALERLFPLGLAHDVNQIALTNVAGLTR